MRRVPCLFVLGVLPVAASCEMAAPPPRAPSASPATSPVASRAVAAPRDARELWLGYCASCHGTEGQGTPVATVRMHAAWQRGRPDSVLRARITHGVAGTTMAPWGRQLGATEIEALIGHIRTLGR